MHYYQFNIGDYRKDTTHLLPIEHYIYRTLIDWYYLDELPIPKITQVVMRRLSLGLENEPNLLNVLNDFFKLEENGWNHARINQEIIEYHAKALKNKVNGKKGGRPPKKMSEPEKTQVVIDGFQDANPSESQINPNHKPLTINHNKKHIIKSERFDDFWSLYPKTPRKVGKTACSKKWRAKNLDLISDKIISHITIMKSTKQWKDGFEPAPLTYINQERWNDEVNHDNEVSEIKGGLKFI